jgi:DNA invertase Pin-like site-specific DNA recombinase
MTPATTTAANGKPRAYSYLRFSTPEQAQGDSARRQIDLATRYAATHGAHPRRHAQAPR